MHIHSRSAYVGEYQHPMLCLACMQPGLEMADAFQCHRCMTGHYQWHAHHREYGLEDILCTQQSLQKPWHSKQGCQGQCSLAEGMGRHHLHRGVFAAGLLQR